MSVVIAVHDKDRFVIGADKQASTGGTKDHASTKIWQVSDLPGAVMGGVGSARASQIIQYSHIIDKNNLDVEPTTEFIVCSLAPVIAATLKDAGITFSSDEEVNCPLMPNSFIFAYQDKAWMIWNDLSVTEIGDYFTIGSGADVANGVLYATPGKNPFERIVTCIDAAAESTLFVDHGVDLLATKMYPSDERQVSKLMGADESAEEPQKKASNEPVAEKTKKDKK